MWKNTKITPEIAIIIPAHNEDLYIKECIQSIKRQKTNFLYTIYVINNTSTDNTVKICRKLGINIINEPQKGLHRARQAGLVFCEADILIYVDADTRLPEDWLDNVVRYMIQQPAVVAVSSNYRFYDGRWSFKLLFSIEQLFIAHILPFLMRITDNPEPLVGSAFAVRSKALHNTGGFNSKFPFYGEDIALAFQLNKEGKVRLLNKLYIKTSARRFMRLGWYHVHKIYVIMGFQLLFGKADYASRFAKKQKL